MTIQANLGAAEDMRGYLSSSTGARFRIATAIRNVGEMENDIDLVLDCEEVDWNRLNKAFEKIGFRYMGTFVYDRGVEGETWYSSARRIGVDIYYPNHEPGAIIGMDAVGQEMRA